jgi:hypothetical protein
MAELIDIIMKKPEWAQKIAQTQIVQTWRAEAAAQNIHPNVFACVIELLREYKKTKPDYYSDETDYDWPVQLGVNLINDLGVVCNCQCACCVNGHNRHSSEDDKDLEENPDDSQWMRAYKLSMKLVCECSHELRIARFQRFTDKFVLSTTLDDPEFKASFMNQIGQLESTFTSIDYHPGSNNQVIDLVHPSLYCYVKGVTEPGSASVVPVTDAVFQWLPSEFHVVRGANGESVETVTVDSYINNLPREANEGLYNSIGQVFGKMVPQFDALLDTLHDCGRLKAPNGDAVKLSHCQVIVKLANIVIAPGEADGFSGHWHLEGMATERIVATGIYYYNMTNVEPNALQFRSSVDDTSEISYPQNGDEYVRLHYGMQRQDGGHYTMWQAQIPLGQVETKEDMLLVFPNFLQHKVSDVHLQDSAQQGTRKILCFFLISPYEHVVSTAHVTPQQQAQGGTMTLEEAQQYRELLMFQRKYELSDQSAFFERNWSLCEH